MLSLKYISKQEHTDQNHGGAETDEMHLIRVCTVGQHSFWDSADNMHIQ